MWLAIVLLLVAYSNAEAINSTITATIPEVTNSTKTLPEDKQLEKLSKSCILENEYKEVLGCDIARFFARPMFNLLLQYSYRTIGLEELRSVQGLRPRGPWKPWRYESKLNETELATILIEQYYEIREPQYLELIKDNTFALEKTVTKAIKYLDRRFPEVRNYFRKKLQRALENRKVDRDTVDDMIKKFLEIEDRVEKAFEDLKWSSFACQSEEDRRSKKVEY
uniref:Uncharacterized protein n=1 Tax=Caenorhabditis tropicalis TaxID=1561998 RepID=A0A1I7TI84_9PELO